MSGVPLSLFRGFVSACGGANPELEFAAGQKRYGKTETIPHLTCPQLFGSKTRISDRP
jgi:hypothetical protein